MRMSENIAISRLQTFQIKSYSDFDPVNGSICGEYAWSQTMNDIEIRIPLPLQVNQKRQVKFEMKCDSLLIEYQLENSTISPISGKLLKPIKVSESFWTLLRGQHIMVNLEKREHIWWNKLLTSENGINMKELNVEREFHTLPDEDQANIKEFMWKKEQDYKSSHSNSDKN